MCKKVMCRRCHKATWAGCGRHIEQTLAEVPKSQRCSCHERAASSTEAPKGLLARLLGR